MRRALVLLIAVAGCRPDAPPPPAEAPQPRLVWTFEAPQPGSSVAAPLVTDSAVYFGAVHSRGFRLSGAVYCLDPATGKRRWTFDRGGDMLPTASNPVIAGGHLLFGEGMHANFVCKFYAIDPVTGAPRWDFTTGDHVEGGAVAADGVVYFPAGNDGIYALDAATGNQKWNFRSDLHTDSTPCASGGRLFFGSGASRKFKSSWVVCLDAKSGEVVWRMPVPLPAWGPPVVADGKVFVGLGNGRLHEPAQPPEVPGGALYCFDATTGEQLWTFAAKDAVFTQPVVAAGRVVFGSRDGHLYGLTFGGTEAFRVPMGGPVMASPTLDGEDVVAVSVPGRIACIDPRDGREKWRHELSGRGAEVLVFAPPRVSGRRLYVGAETKAGTTGVVTLHCFELPTP